MSLDMPTTSASSKATVKLSGENVDTWTPVAAPVANTKIQAWWLIAAGGASGLLLVLVVVALVCYVFRKRRRLKAKVAEGKSEDSGKQLESNVTTLTTSMETSVETSISPYPANNRHHRPLRPSLSMEVGMPFYLRKQNVQPPVAFSRWTPLNAPRASIGSIQPDLYKSSDSDDGSSPPTDSGRLWFSLFYQKEENSFKVTLIRARHLPGRGFNKGERDPFVKVFLLPDEENFHQSKVRRRTLSPKFNEIFEFSVSEEELRTRCLRFSVYDVDSRKVRHSLGHVLLPLAKVDLEQNLPMIRDLEKSPQMHTDGEIQIALSCNPYNNKMKVTIFKLRNIQGIEEGNVFVYVKIQLYHGNRMIKSKCTSSHTAVGAHKSEVIFHEKVCFGVPARFYDSCFLHISVCVPAGAVSKDASLGKVTIGPFLFARGEQLLHWQEMITNPRNLVTKWHKLESPAGNNH